ncbi:hypothetical protein BC941DRAFT_464608 [Chlamydoabsidia padenii]|nr:hypothetical protein BC941DRAFT_464608 [Chlamydoabsidia padenii]
MLPISSKDGVVHSTVHFFLNLLTNSSTHHSTHSAYLQLAYPDLSIHLSRHTLYSFIDLLYHHPNQSKLIITFTNIGPILTNLVLSAGARRIMTTPNAGGSSVWSEALSAELLYRLVGASVTKTEMEITYNRRGSPITDYACQLNDTVLGVSVTRAMAFRRSFEKKDALRLLTKKLNGINASTLNVTNCTFARQILHVWTQSGRDAATVKRVWAKLPESLRSNTIVLVTSVNTPLLFFEKQHKTVLKQEKKKKPFKVWF